MAKGGGTFGVAATVVAFACMAYEMALAQSMATIYGDTINSYSLVIGLFVLSLGLGAAFWARASLKPTAKIFWAVEMILAILGLVAPFLVFGAAAGKVAICALALVIGFFSGMEIPLLIALAHQRHPETFGATRLIIGLDFIGTFLAAVGVPLVLFAWLGLVGVPFFGALLNLLLGAGALMLPGVDRIPARAAVTGILLVVAALALSRIAPIEVVLSGWVF